MSGYSIDTEPAIPTGRDLVSVRLHLGADVADAARTHLELPGEREYVISA